MKSKYLFLLIVFQCMGILMLSAQTAATNIEIQSEDVNISASGDVKLSTGASGKTYYNGKEVAVKGEASRSATIIVAAANASERSKAGADIICTGENDHLVIQSVLDELKENGGSIVFSEGTFYFQSQVIPSGKIKMSGQGSATVFTGKEPYSRSYFGMIMCGNDLELILQDMTFFGNFIGGLKAITCQYGPLYGEPDVFISEGENIKSINLQSLTFENFDVRPISIAGTSPIGSMIVNRVVLRNVPDLYFGPVVRLTISDILDDSVYYPDNRIRIGSSAKSCTLNNIISEGKIFMDASGTVSSCRCKQIELSYNSKHCIVFGNKTTSGISNLGVSNQIFNNY